MLPEWLDADTLQRVVLAVIGTLLIGMYLTARFVRKIVTRLLLYVVLVGLAGGLWIQRAQLNECAQTCECTLFGQEVAIPENRRPDRCG